MRKFTIPARRFSTIALPFGSSFVQVRAGAPECANTVLATSDRRADGDGQSLSNHGCAAVAIRLSRAYWQSNDR